MIRFAIVAAGMFCAVCCASPASAALTFTDWTSVDGVAETASGSLGPIAVSLTGTDIATAVTDNTYTAYDSAAFTPSLPSSDMVEFRGHSPAYSYTLTFSSPVTNPRLHLATLASTLDFGSIPLTRLSGDADFVVAGSTVTGAFHGTTDANGTVLLTGTFTSIPFTALWLGPTEVDGIDIQVGADPLPEPSFASCILLGGVVALLRRRRQHAYASSCCF